MWSHACSCAAVTPLSLFFRASRTAAFFVITVDILKCSPYITFIRHSITLTAMAVKDLAEIKLEKPTDGISKELFLVDL
jgi:hypothetical protein